MYLDLFSKHVEKLKHTSGNEYVGLCPFHEDKHPSFSVNVENGLWKCFSGACAKQGNHITFERALGISETFEKKDKHATTVTTEHLENLKKIGKSLSTRVISHFGIYHSFYNRTGSTNIINYFGLPTKDGYNKRLEYEHPDDKGKVRWKLPSRKRVETVSKGSYIGKLYSNDTIYLCEGEWDAFTLTDLDFDNAVSFTGGSGNIPSHHLEKFADKRVYICYDFDEAGIKGAKKLAERLFKYTRNIRIIDWEKSGLQYGSGDLKDISDYVYKLGKTREDFLALTQTATLYQRQLDRDTLKETVEGIEEEKEISEYILSILTDFGFFVKSIASKNLYWFNETDRSLYALDKRDKKLGYFINQFFGVNQEKSEYKVIVADLETYANYNGKLTNIHNFAFYNEVSNQLFIYNNDKIVYRISEDAIHETANGDDNVLFVENESLEPFKYNPVATRKESLLEKYLFSIINFAYDPKAHSLTVEEQKLLFKYYFFSLFFASLLGTKPLLILSGMQGSGKSMIMKLLLYLFLGKNKSVKTLPDDEKEMKVALKNNYFLFFDNVDERIDPKIRDIIASASTGVEISMRQLFTTAEEVNFIPLCFLGFGTRTNVLNRQDISDRALIFSVKRFADEERITDKQLEEYIGSNKDEMWSEILVALKQQIGKLKKYNKDSKTGATLRIADFCNLAVQLAGEKERPQLERAFSKMSVSQSIFSLEDDVFYNVMENLASENNGTVTFALERDAMYEIFKETAERMGIDTEQRRHKGAGFPTASGFTKYLRKKLELYEKSFHYFKITEDRNPKVILYHTSNREKSKETMDRLISSGSKMTINSTIGNVETPRIELQTENVKDKRWDLEEKEDPFCDDDPFEVEMLKEKNNAVGYK